MMTSPHLASSSQSNSFRASTCGRMGLSLSVLCVAWCCAVCPQSYMSFKRMTGFCKTLVPQQVWDDLQPIKNDDEAVKNYGIHYATKMSRQDYPPPPLPALSSISPTCSPLHSLACHPSPPPPP